MQYRALGKTGLNVSVLGYGASPLGGVFGDVEALEGVRAVHAALDHGVNFFDVAPYYGLTRAETALGNALHGIPRDKYILATKVGRYGPAEFDFSAGRILRELDLSLKRLQVDAVDIITCHDIEFVSISQVLNEAIPALEKARDQGKLRFIGVSGLPLKVYHTVLDRTPLDTVLSYCHHTLNDNSLADHLDYFEAKQVGVINASPFAMGLLTGRAVPEWHPAPQPLRAACRLAAERCREHGMEIAELALQYSVSNTQIATTLVGMAGVQEVEQNVAWLNTPPDPHILAEILATLEPIHNQTWPSGLPENN